MANTPPEARVTVLLLLRQPQRCMDGISTKSCRFMLGCATVLLTHGAPAQLNLTLLHSFNGGPDGRQPNASLVQATDGSLYGTTYMGGSNDVGTVFKVNPDG